jgi:DNA-binding LytR/AlgR family response regulator
MIFNEKTKKDIPLNTILYIEATGNYCTLHRVNVIRKKEVYARSMKNVQSRIGEGFTRINRKYLVNNQYVTAFSEQSVFIRELNIWLPISRRKSKKALLNFNNHLP